MTQRQHEPPKWPPQFMANLAIRTARGVDAFGTLPKTVDSISSRLVPTETEKLSVLKITKFVQHHSQHSRKSLCGSAPGPKSGLARLPQNTWAITAVHLAVTERIHVTRMGTHTGAARQMPISAFTGTGLAMKRQEPLANWSPRGTAIRYPLVSLGTHHMFQAS